MSRNYVLKLYLCTVRIKNKINEYISHSFYERVINQSVIGNHFRGFKQNLQPTHGKHVNIHQPQIFLIWRSIKYKYNLQFLAKMFLHISFKTPTVDNLLLAKTPFFTYLTLGLKFSKFHVWWSVSFSFLILQQS